MIRVATLDDSVPLARIYSKSIYCQIPKIVDWALREEPDRVIVVEEQGKVLGCFYTMICGYNNLWASYLVFVNEGIMKQLISYMMKIRKEHKLRNLYIFCPKDFVSTRVELISRGFVPEGTQNLGALDYVIEVHTGAFNPECSTAPQRENLQVLMRGGHSDDTMCLGKILHESLPRDFETVDHAVHCINRWLNEMPRDIIVAEHKGISIGVILLSREIYPVLDERLAMISYIAVAEGYRGKGIGGALVKEACNALKSADKKGLEVDVSVGNLQARIFYTKAGFYPYWYSKNYMRHDDGIFYRRDF